MKRLSLGLTLVAVLLVGACVYDYVPPMPEEGEGEVLVINGDILIGQMTEIQIGRMVKVGGESSGNLRADLVYVEDNAGGRYPGAVTEEIRYLIDTRDADPAKDYRLVVEKGGSVYESAWQPVLQAAEIDSLSYSFNDNRDHIHIEVSSHSDDNNRYYKWKALQTWEYHSASNALYFYVPAGGSLDGSPVPVDTVVSYENRVNYYFCWNTGEVSDLLMASTAQMSENRFVRHRLYSMECHEPRTQMVYSVDLYQEAVSEEAWRYYEALKNNSQNVGGLFSPQPSEVKGNIRERSHPERQVIGYVSVTRPSVKRLTIDFESFLFHKLGDWERVAGEIVADRQNWGFYYQHSYLVTYPIMMDESINDNRFEWAFARCVDCRMLGGNKNKPDWWPNDHR